MTGKANVSSAVLPLVMSTIAATNGLEEIVKKKTQSQPKKQRPRCSTKKANTVSSTSAAPTVPPTAKPIIDAQAVLKSVKLPVVTIKGIPCASASPHIAPASPLIVPSTAITQNSQQSQKRKSSHCPAILRKKKKNNND